MSIMNSFNMTAKLSKMTGAKMEDCIKALEETNNDINAAMALLGVERRVFNSDMRSAKYEIFIEDINKMIMKCIRNTLLSIGGFIPSTYSSIYGINKQVTSPLHLIFDPYELNEYGYIICQKAIFELEGSENNRYPADPWARKYKNTVFGEDKIKIDAAKDFVKYCREDNNRPEAYKFIFWALMILTVYKENYDEKLSLICDFARMLRITDEEMMDIAYTVKCIYNEVETEYAFKSDMVPSVLGNLFNFYGNTDIDIR